MHLDTKFNFITSSGSGWVFYTTMGLAAIFSKCRFFAFTYARSYQIWCLHLQ